MDLHSLVVDEREHSLQFRVRVIPRAKKNEIVGVMLGALKVKLAAPPVEGAANEALVRFLAERLDVRASQIEILAGERSRTKTLQVSGLSLASLREALQG